MATKKPRKKLTPEQFAKNELRKAFRRWHGNNECKKKARIDRGQYVCKKCEQIFKEKETEVDHREPVVPLDTPGKEQSMDEYVKRLFVEVEELDLLCKPCHKIKSSQEMSMRKFYRDQKKNE